MVDIHSIEYIIGQNIKKYRVIKGWSQTKLGNAVDINRTDISKYENGCNGDMSVKRLKKIADALDVSVGQLFSEADEEPAANASNMQKIYDQLSAFHKSVADTVIRGLLLQQNTVIP